MPGAAGSSSSTPGIAGTSILTPKRPDAFPERRAVKIRRSGVVAAFGVLTAGLAVSALVLAWDSDPPEFPGVAALVGLLVLPFGAVGALITSRRPGNPIGPLFCAVSLLQAVNLAGFQYGLAGAPPRSMNLPAAAEAIWLADLLWFPSVALLVTFLPLLFPTGRPPTPRWLWVGWLSGGALALTIVVWAALTWPGSGVAVAGDDSEVELSGFGLLLPIGMLGVAAAAFFSLVSLGVRVRRSRGEERQQLWWFMWAMAVSIAAVLAAFLVTIPDRSPLVRDVLLGLAVLTVPLATGIAITRYRLYDIDLLVNRTLVYGGLTAVVLSVYVTTVTVTGRLVQDLTDWQTALPATGMVALVMLPLRDRLQIAVNRLMYGDRDDPYGALARLGRHLESVRSPGDTLSGLVATVASALRLRYVAVHLDPAAQSSPVAAWGSTPDRPTVFPLAYRGDNVGSLSVGHRGSGEQLGPRDRAVLEALATQAGVAVHAERLTLDLKRSRQELVSAREEERRRLRRDLHDGLGPTLAGVALGVEAAGNLLERKPGDAAAILGTVHDQVKSAIDDVRRLVEGLRPPALDELGLLDAIRSYAVRFEALAARDGENLRITVLPAEPLPVLPAAVETAAYRIALEAITNVARHAGARHCQVRVTCNETLDVEVTDDGHGIPARPPGVGMASMRERAAELGGSCTVASRPGGGTDVLARLPVTL